MLARAYVYARGSNKEVLLVSLTFPTKRLSLPLAVLVSLTSPTKGYIYHWLYWCQSPLPPEAVTLRDPHTTSSAGAHRVNTTVETVNNFKYLYLDRITYI